MNHKNHFSLLQTENSRHHQNTKYLKEVKNKDEKTLLKLKFISDNLFKALFENFYHEKTSYD